MKINDLQRCMQLGTRLAMRTPLITQTEVAPCLLDKVEKLIKDNKVEFVDLRFADVRGVQHHVTFPANHRRRQSLFEDGKMFDGSSISGWKGINESDMVLLPDAGDRVPRSVHRRPDPGPDLRHPRPGDHAGLLARPARRRQARRSLPQVQRHRRAGVLRPGARILHLRLACATPTTWATPSSKIDSEEAAWNTGTRSTKAATPATVRA